MDSLKALDPNRPIREADIERPALDVRFTPKSGHQVIIAGCPLSANSDHTLARFGLMHRSKSRLAFRTEA